jgi:Chitin synthase export chaperone
MGLVTSCIWCLFLNGFVGFQWWDDGTTKSLWGFRISTLLVCCLQYAVSIMTFMDVVPGVLAHKSPIILFVIFVVGNLLLLLTYFIMQVVLVIQRLDNRWPIGSMCFAAVFFSIGLAFIFVSVPICESANHYIDGYFFAVAFTLLSVMMVYKYWDSITSEDWEFSIPANKVGIPENIS